ncbi:probable leucine-rich repeat receptor-like serine/threonine-protein kinase At3g14840 isoform X1 [Salvia splendens]|uniref:probable leucine-rich repeat receptor-like serine/threonine-protein kinase At3g14840 isoform X1 n=1 Tax=Salvia splendens TaxID=180675 RepID=UPI001C272FC1|nr:probable leucine-rich repeat receptor-like serine/threonine-protein kinase At3g14840 isoform X1 [Salvia splendens]
MLLVLIWFLGFANYVTSACLPAQELNALSVVARKLGKRDWNFVGVVDPCTKELPWWDASVIDGKGVKCNSTSPGNDTTTCHITEIILKKENLNGSLPKELVGLPFLQVLDLTRNYLNGTLPPEWGSMEFLRKISVLGNRLTGPIPPEYGKMTALEELVLEANQFAGNIPGEFGDLPRLKKLQLASNNFTGELSPNLAKITTLVEFRISDNNFTGSIPSFILKWGNITRLEIQASGLSGPIPSNFTSLTKLNDLRISDLNGSQSNFPNLAISTSWKQVILRSCNIVGELPPYIAQLAINDSLDLSFNKLTGQIPRALGGQSGDIYLTGNFLNGTVPQLKEGKGNIDLSYNNFTSCTANSLKLSGNSNGHTNGTFYCVNPMCKPNDFHSFYINCGSKENVGKYEADYFTGNFYQGKNWGFNSTGKFWNTDKYGNSNLREGQSSISGPESKLYSTARLSPLSLTYYGFCLRNGNYTVKLHFAEIMFTDDKTYGSLGRRVFDIYIQGNLVEKDFNIENAAGGVNNPKTMPYHAIVGDHTLEIRFYWAGKGTTVLPERSVYGPLISAISVVHATYKPGSISTGAKVGIAMAAICALVLLVAVMRLKGCLGVKHSMYHDLKGLDLRTGKFTLRQIRAATNNFDPANKIGEGGFGPVYKGVLLDKTIIAVKQLSSKSKQGNREFINEIGMISALQHPHLVKLYGCCIEGNQLLLVYEYLENNSLARALFGPEEHKLHLDWPMRQKICIGIARGLAYLHEESRLKIVHRDIKATNVLLDKNLVPKISDFGLAKLDEEDNTHISTRIAGTFGYMAPEYAMRGYLTDKADVYSFGIVVLEIISGRSNSSIRPKEDSFYLLDWANSLKARGHLLELVDRRLESSFNKEEITRAINVALICTNVVAAERPSMSAVVSILEGKDGVPKFVSESSFSAGKTKPDEVEMGAFESEVVSADAPWSGSSTSAADLYPVAPDTNYWVKRGS